jgi:hypothetical protein
LLCRSIDSRTECCLPCLLPHQVSRFRLFSFSKYLLSASSNLTSKYCTLVLQVSEFARGFDSVLHWSHLSELSLVRAAIEEPGFSRIPSSFGLTRCFNVLKHVQSRSDDEGDAVMKLGERIVFCYTVDKYFNLLLIAFKTLSVVQLPYLHFSY